MGTHLASCQLHLLTQFLQNPCLITQVLRKPFWADHSPTACPVTLHYSFSGGREASRNQSGWHLFSLVVPSWSS